MSSLAEYVEKLKNTKSLKKSQSQLGNLRLTNLNVQNTFQLEKPQTPKNNLDNFLQDFRNSARKDAHQKFSTRVFDNMNDSRDHVNNNDSLNNFQDIFKKRMSNNNSLQKLNASNQGSEFLQRQQTPLGAQYSQDLKQNFLLDRQYYENKSVNNYQSNKFQYDQQKAPSNFDKILSKINNRLESKANSEIDNSINQDFNFLEQKRDNNWNFQLLQVNKKDNWSDWETSSKKSDSSSYAKRLDSRLEQLENLGFESKYEKGINQLLPYQKLKEIIQHLDHIPTSEINNLPNNYLRDLMQLAQIITKKIKTSKFYIGQN